MIQLKKNALVKCSAPLFNSSHFHKIFGGTDGSSFSLEKELEMIAFAGSKLTIEEQIAPHIVRIKYKDYSSRDSLFTDDRFLIFSNSAFHENKTRLPSPDEILDFLLHAYELQLPYLWGGNFCQGIPELLEFYPPSSTLDLNTQTLWQLKGVDCSGLLYEATCGYTPRNSSQLVTYGRGVTIQEKKPEDILSQLHPLDLIVWPGHVIIALSKDQWIESRGGRGVIISSASSRLKELMEKRKPLNHWNPALHKDGYFVIRRWHPKLALLYDEEPS